MNKYCFVIQPFEEVYDKRFEDIYRTAIEKTGLNAYRVDKDSSVRNIIGEIEKRIKDSELCFADISEDKPNVWYELGYASAIGKDVVMVCDNDKREKLPFDINQRSVIFYDADSPSDFKKLEMQIAGKIEAYNNTRKNINTLTETPISDARGFAPYELALLAFLIAEIDGTSFYMLTQRMANAGFNDVATSLGVKLLIRKGLVVVQEREDDEGYKYKHYTLTEDGENFVLDNTHLFDTKQKTTKYELPF